ncbi:hypothetical protein [Planococcus maitriensis]|uniref:hypothetical protein n=1 Tax=Planococcus maitriensis TaxID=221799 RepID=UPI0011BDEF5A|nr:hypothetical protein [Planococcus maitriensis]
MKGHMSLSTKQTHNLNLLNQRLFRCTISGSDSHTSRQLHIEADAIKQSTGNEISQLPAPRVSRRSRRKAAPNNRMKRLAQLSLRSSIADELAQLTFANSLLPKANPKQGSEYYQEEK